MRAPNPFVGTHPDMLEGESRVHVPLEELSREEIVALPRNAFSWDEWDELDSDVQGEIYSKGEDAKRIKALAKVLANHAKWAVSEDAFDASSELDLFEMWLNDRSFGGDILDRVDGWDDIYDKWIAEGYSEDQVKNALKEALLNQNNWTEEISDSCTGEYSHELKGSIYIERSYVRQESDLKRYRDDWFESDVEWAMEWLKDSDDYDERAAADIYDYHEDDIWETLDPDSKKRYPTVNIENIDTDRCFNVDPNWDYVASDVSDKLLGKPPEAFEVPEERRIMEFDDGLYVADLTPPEMLKEGPTQGMCVHRPEHGYLEAVAKGETKILSLRRPSGKPLLTFEVALDRNGNPKDVLQIKGKGNRLPGWDRGGEGRGKFKAREVRLALHVIDELGLGQNLQRLTVVRDSRGDLRPGLEALKGTLKSNPRFRPYKTFSDPVGPV